MTARTILLSGPHIFFINAANTTKGCFFFEMDSDTTIVHSATVTALLAAGDEQVPAALGQSRDSEDGIPPVEMTEDQMEQMLMEEDPVVACRIYNMLERRTRCAGYSVRLLLVLMPLMAAFFLLVLGGTFMPSKEGIVMIEMGTIVVLVVAMLVFYVYPADNPIRVSIRRCLYLSCGNRRFVSKVMSIVIALLGVGTTVTAIALSIVMINDAGARNSTPVIRATVSMWVIGFVLCFPLGGARRVRMALHEDDGLN